MNNSTKTSDIEHWEIDLTIEEISHDEPELAQAFAMASELPKAAEVLEFLHGDDAILAKRMRSLFDPIIEARAIALIQGDEQPAKKKNMYGEVYRNPITVPEAKKEALRRHQEHRDAAISHFLDALDMHRDFFETAFSETPEKYLFDDDRGEL